mmetsp:Transcript_2529/g.6321  ORF Transcript_2529/g.6321 Transcript_2529/m.6321 type:complete len:248 (+) Transcript_2529:766-1509(+)
MQRLVGTGGRQRRRAAVAALGSAVLQAIEVIGALANATEELFATRAKGGVEGEHPEVGAAKAWATICAAHRLRTRGVQTLAQSGRWPAAAKRDARPAGTEFHDLAASRRCVALRLHPRRLLRPFVVDPRRWAQRNYLNVFELGIAVPRPGWIGRCIWQRRRRWLDLVSRRRVDAFGFPTAALGVASVETLEVVHGRRHATIYLLSASACSDVESVDSEEGPAEAGAALLTTHRLRTNRIQTPAKTLW